MNVPGLGAVDVLSLAPGSPAAAGVVAAAAQHAAGAAAAAHAGGRGGPGDASLPPLPPGARGPTPVAAHDPPIVAMPSPRGGGRMGLSSTPPIGGGGGACGGGGVGAAAPGAAGGGPAGLGVSPTLQGLRLDADAMMMEEDELKLDDVLGDAMR